MGTLGHGATVLRTLRILQWRVLLLKFCLPPLGYVGPGQRTACMWLTREIVQLNTAAWSAIVAGLVYFFHRWPSYRTQLGTVAHWGAQRSIRK